MVISSSGFCSRHVYYPAESYSPALPAFAFARTFIRWEHFQGSYRLTGEGQYPLVLTAHTGAVSASAAAPCGLTVGASCTATHQTSAGTLLKSRSEMQRGSRHSSSTQVSRTSSIRQRILCCKMLIRTLITAILLSHAGLGALRVQKLIEVPLQRAQTLNSLTADRDAFGN